MSNPFHSCNLWALAPEFAEGVAELYHRACQSNGEVQPLAQTTGPDEIARSIIRQQGHVAVISINGPIDRTSVLGWRSGQLFVIGQDAIRCALDDALKDPSVRGILLSINSPGGVVAGTKELADYIAEAASRKPVGAYVDGLAASAAYWLASATGRVLAPATGQVGSIGVIMMVADFSGYYKRAGVSFEYIASGKYKAAGRGERPLTDEERAYFQGKLSALHDVFRGDVASRMQITAPVEHWAEAQVMLGKQGKELGLVNAIVRDEAAAIQTMMEVSMPDYTREALAKDAPDLLAALKNEGREEALAEARGKLDEAVKAAGEDGAACALAAMRAVCTPETVQAVEAMLEKARTLGLTAAQLGGMAELFGKAPSSAGQIPVPQSHQAILGALQAAHAPSVNTNVPPTESKSALVADAERRAQHAI